MKEEVKLLFIMGNKKKRI